MKKYYPSILSQQFSTFIFKFVFSSLFLFFTYSVSAQTSYTLSPVADAFIRNGNYAANNYGGDTSLIIKGSTSSGYTDHLT